MPEMKKHHMLIGGEWVDPQSGEWFESMNPFTAEPWALIPRGNKDGCRSSRGRCASAPSTATIGASYCHRARRASCTDLADLIAAEADKLGGDRDHRQRQTDRRNARAVELHSAVVPLFRRPRRQNRRPRDSHRQAGRFQFHARGAAGRRRRHHAVEFAAAAGHLETRAGAGGGNTVVWKPSEFSSVSALAFGEFSSAPVFRPAS